MTEAWQVAGVVAAVLAVVLPLEMWAAWPPVWFGAGAVVALAWRAWRAEEM